MESVFGHREEPAFDGEKLLRNLDRITADVPTNYSWTFYTQCKAIC